MAKVIINGAQFRPFTMDELLKPLALATQEHHRIQDQYDAMAQEASFWDLILPKDGESKSRQAYQSYMDDMQAQVNALNENGLNPQVRANISRIRRNNPIQAFNVAYDALQKENQIRQQRGNNAVYQQPTLTIDDFLFGNTPNNTYADLNDIRNQVATSAQAYAKTLMESPEVMNKIAGGQYYVLAQRQGLPMALITAIQNGYISPEELTTQAQQDAFMGLNGLVSEMKNNLGYDLYSTNDQGFIDQAINQGLLTGIQTTSYSTADNKGFETAAQRANRLATEYALQRQQEEDDFNESMYYTHSDPNNPTAANRTGYTELGLQATSKRKSSNDNNGPEYNWTTESGAINGNHSHIKVSPENKGQEYNKGANVGIQDLPVAYQHTLMRELGITDWKSHIDASKKVDKATADRINSMYQINLAIGNKYFDSGKGADFQNLYSQDDRYHYDDLAKDIQISWIPRGAKRGGQSPVSGVPQPEVNEDETE